MTFVQKLLVILLLIIGYFSEGQTNLQIKSFINRTQVVVFKAQKEILNKSQKELEQDLKSIVKNQVIAVKLYNDNQHKDALAFSFYSREAALELLQKISPGTEKTFKLNEEENSFCNPLELKLSSDSNILNESENSIILKLDVLNAQNLREIALSIP